MTKHSIKFAGPLELATSELVLTDRPADRPKRVLVTGWRGTIGRPLTRELWERGHDVWGIDLLHGDDPRHVRADIAEFHQLERAFEKIGPEVVVHLAAEFGRVNGERYTEQLWRTNVVGTRNVLQLSHEHRATMIFASSSEVYGDGYEGLLAEELTEIEPPHLTNEYAISKYTNELQIRSFVERHGSRVGILRFFNAYGPGERYTPYRSVVALFCYRALAGIPFDVYSGYHRTFMHIDDFVPTLARAVATWKPDPGTAPVVNVGGTDYRSVEELADLVLGLTGNRAGLVRRLGQEEHNVRDKRPAIERARQLFGHDPQIRLEEGVPGTVEWLRKEHGL